MAKTYVIRRLAYIYTDEFYYSGSSTAAITAVYQHETVARAALDRLEIAKIRGLDLGFVVETCPYSIGDRRRSADNEARRQRFQAYCEAEFGRGLLTGRLNGSLFANGGTKLPADATDEQVLQVREILGLAYHVISVFEAEPVFYGIWVAPDAAFLQDVESYGTWFFDSYDDALSRIEVVDGPVNRFEIRGTIEELSDQPELLRSALAQCKVISYDLAKGRLCLYNVCGGDIMLINPLLREPLFEIRPVTLEEAMRLRPADRS